MKGTAERRRRVYASGAATLGGYFPGVDTFLGLQVAAQEIADDLARRGWCRPARPGPSARHWLRWVPGRSIGHPQLKEGSTMVPRSSGGSRPGSSCSPSSARRSPLLITPLLPPGPLSEPVPRDVRGAGRRRRARCRLGAALPPAHAVPLGEGLAVAVRPAHRGAGGLLLWWAAASAGWCRARGRRPVTAFVIHFGAVWLAVWLVANGPMRVPFLRWRFRGGRLL